LRALPKAKEVDRFQYVNLEAALKQAISLLDGKVRFGPCIREAEILQVLQKIDKKLVSANVITFDILQEPSQATKKMNYTLGSAVLLLDGLQKLFTTLSL